jgi:small neutral amino acid transporter SnatA (MarC family)
MWYFLLRSLYQNFAFIAHFSHVPYMSHVLHPSSFNHCNKTGWREQITKLLIMWLFLVLFYPVHTELGIFSLSVPTLYRLKIFNFIPTQNNR